jgi:serine/threonine protein kinase, bacterial
MSYCLYPSCTSPENPIDAQVCQSCGHQLLMNGRYRVLQGLGQGGFGATYLARDEQLPGQPNCVLKQLRPSTNAIHVIQMARDLFQREAQTLGRIGSHSQIPRLLDYFEANEEFFLVQEYVSGATLQQEVKKHGPFSEAGVKQFLSEILPVLDYVHKSNVIHRDIKPANLIRRAHDRKLVLIDFGAVKNHVASLVETASEQTAFTAYAIGTPGFAPPEQMAMRPVFSSDIYALGVTCVYLLAGKSPKDLSYDTSTGELMWRRNVHVSDHFAGVLEKMLEVSVRHRYSDASEVLEALDMEPYLESLANSMNTGRTTPTKSEPTTAERLDSLTPMQRAAQSIRSRQARPEAPTAPDVSAGTSYRREDYRRDVVTVRPATASGIKTDGELTGRRIDRAMDHGGERSIGRPFSSEVGLTPHKISADELRMAYLKGDRDFMSQDLSNLRLKRMDLTGAMFHGANLTKVNMTGATLSGVDFGRTSLVRANLRDAIMARAYLSNADLQEADLRGADLRGAYLLNANLRGTNLCGANLTGAKLAPEQLAMAKTNWMTVKPNGKR